MSRRGLAVLLIVLLLVMAAVPLAISLSSSFDGIGSSFGLCLFQPLGREHSREQVCWLKE